MSKANPMATLTMMVGVSGSGKCAFVRPKTYLKSNSNKDPLEDSNVC